jgi:hypothetical protein
MECHYQHELFPYHMIQYWDEPESTWIDIQRRFSNLCELIDFARDNLDMDLTTRIVVVDGNGRQRVCKGINAFGIKSDSDD